MESLDFLESGPRPPIFTGAPSTDTDPGVEQKSLLQPEPVSSLWPDDSLLQPENSLLRPEDSLDKTVQTKNGKPPNRRGQNEEAEPN